MKRTVILIACMLMSLPLLGQSIKAYGLKTGLSIANQSIEYPISDLKGPEDNLNNVCVGGFIEWQGKSKFSLLTEILYVKKGASEVFIVTGEDGPEPLGTEHWNYWIHYLSIPIAAKWNMSLSRYNFYALFGPRIDIRLGQGNELTGYDFSDPLMDSSYDDYEKVDFGFDIGAGVELFTLPMFSLLAEYRFSPAVTDVYDSDTLNIRNQSHEVMLGFMF